ncbi:hypothetical protein ROZALSC1DRAFT_1102, partial [Rozella allomycis CSF55]
LTDEQLDMLTSSTLLNEKEREALRILLKKYESIFTFDDNLKGKLSSEIFKPVRIHVVEHTPWKRPCPKYVAKELADVIALLRKKLDAGFLEYCESAYANRWFVLRKRNGSLRM